MKNQAPAMKRAIYRFDIAGGVAPFKRGGICSWCLS